MNAILKTLLVIGTVLFLTFIVYMVRKKKLELKYTIIWLIASIVLVIFAVFDSLSIALSALLNIAEPVNAIFLAIFLFLILMQFMLTIYISKSNDRIRVLTQALALKELDSKSEAGEPSELSEINENEKQL
ncbi:MAG: DUF2304 domain-containing protein [Clostridiales bacterium]|jgi:hypothetical protein|nr:DUF2304 domain-containing protein [Clostridiales bacterium]